jgi:MoaA/NifB/PqqE/SkfB family radical SAM enzyme
MRATGLQIPFMVMLSPTTRCNFDCFGCYSRTGSEGELTLGEMDSLMTQAGELGIGAFIITGGEPFLLDGLAGLLSDHGGLLFIVFSNGSLIDARMAAQIAGAGNIVPALSVEGGPGETDARRGPGAHAQVLSAMDHLRAAGADFGFSVMVTRENAGIVGERRFFSSMASRGCRVGFLNGYVPAGPDPRPDLVMDRNTRESFRDSVLSERRRRRMLLVHLPEDEFADGGVCMAAGRGFLHVNPHGWVEPCAFCRLASHNIRSCTLREALGSKLFAHIRETPGLLAPPVAGCVLHERRDSILERSDLGARSTIC